MLEEKIQKLTEALVENTKALVALNQGPGASVANPKKEKLAAATPKEEKKPAFPTEADIVAACQPILDAGKGAKLKPLAEKYGLAKCREAAGTENGVKLLAELVEMAKAGSSEDAAV